MSDVEAGDSELTENPEPEEDADLSIGANNLPQDGPEPEEDADLSIGANNLPQDDPEPEESRAPDSSQATAGEGNQNEPHQNETGVGSGAGIESGSSSGGEAKAESPLDQQEWPPESERPCPGHDGPVDSQDGVAGEEAEDACMADGVAVVLGETHSARQDSASQPLGPGAECVTENSDQEESPPEDELFACARGSGSEHQADVSSSAAESGDALSPGQTAEEQSSDATESGQVMVSADPGVRVAEHAAPVEAPSQSEQCLPQVSCEVGRAKQASEKEDDQIPECDRERSSLEQTCQPASDTVGSAEGLQPVVSESSPNIDLNEPTMKPDSSSSPPVQEVGGKTHGGEDDGKFVGGMESWKDSDNSAKPEPSGSSPQPEAHPTTSRQTLLPSGSSPQSEDTASSSSPQSEDSASSSSPQAASSTTTSRQTLLPSGSSPQSEDTASSSSAQSAPTTSTSRQTLLALAGQGMAGLRPSFLDDDSEEEELLTELDAELQLHGQSADYGARAPRLAMNGLKDVDVKNSELCKQFEAQLLQLQQTVLHREKEINRLKDEKSRQRQVSQDVIMERDKLKAELELARDKNADDLYLPQIKELEFTLAQQQGEIRQLKDKLTTHDGAAKRAIATLQTEMKARIDQITKLYEEGCREKDAMVVKFAQAETKNIEVKCAAEKLESRVKDLLKEKEFTNNKMRAALAEKQKAALELQAKCGEVNGLHREVEKMKEEVSSTDYRIKWFQNKLKAELEAHKETKGTLEKTTAKLKEAKEETEMIRRDCQAIVKTYQESEEVRSNSLDKELKMKKTELMLTAKEKSETEEINLRTKQELDALKIQHKDALEELKTLKDKVQCLDEERLQGEQMQARYQTIIQKQKADNTALSKQLSDLANLQENFDRAQTMIKTLDQEVGELKVSNRDLQKDIDSCQARESKMLTLQAELSRTNAMLRSDNTNLNNQVATLSGEVQKMKLDIQDLETRCRNLTDQLEEEQRNRKEETSALSTQLAAKTRESDDYRQKLEDEVDASKTWKRKHASNVKDLMRQLQHSKKRLEAYENSGGGDSTSMGSRTNSNGSLNSMDTSNQHNSHHPGSHNHHPSAAPARPASQEPEFPVITEQVEVDKQLLIERIVRLQRSLARKNEKLEFLEEHIQQLVTEIKRKNKIIQDYVVREDAGALVSDVMDANKLAVRKEAQALLARKGGIMASLYSQHQQDGAMNLDLSLEINRKLQAVLEDTLLKNMTLKENLDTLGAEIARLSQENRRLQIHLQSVDAT